MAGCTCMRLRKASRRVTQIYDQWLEPCGLTVSQYGVLANLAKRDGVSIGGLADLLIMDPTTLTRTLRPLQRQGFVAVKPDPTDKRARRLHITASGRHVCETAQPFWRRAQNQIETALGNVEAPALNAALDLVLERLAD